MYRCLSHIGVYFADSKKLKDQNERRKCVSRKIHVFPLKVQKLHYIYSGIDISKHKERAATNKNKYLRQPSSLHIFDNVYHFTHICV